MLIGKTSIEDALKISIIRNSDLENAQHLWQLMLNGEAEWNNDDVPSLHLASSICREISNNTTFELEADLSGNETLKEQFMAAVEHMPEIVSLLSGLGSLVLKPFVRGDKILLTIATPDKFFPIKYNEIGVLTSVAFADTIETAEDFYTLLEVHEWDEPTSTYSIEYRVFHSTQANELGKEISISTVAAWAHLEPINWDNITQPLFVEVNMPNNQSIFASAVQLIRLSDEQYGRAVWEYEGGELAIDADIDLFQVKGIKQGEKPQLLSLPKGKDRLFRKLDFGSSDIGLKVFSPELRDSSLFNGLNEHKRAIEFACGMAYATISDPNMQDKTATEIRSTKQRFLITIRMVQKIIEEAYTHMAESMNILGQLYGLFPASNYEVSFTWGDAVLEDPEMEYKRRLQLLGAGIISPAEFRSWYLEEDIKTAQLNLPAQQTESLE